MPRRTSQDGKQRRHDDLATLDYVARFQAERGRSPSQRQIHRALNMSAPSVAHASVQRLARSGFLTLSQREPGLAGEMTITEDGHKALREWRQQAPGGAHTVGDSPSAALRGAAC